MRAAYLSPCISTARKSGKCRCRRRRSRHSVPSASAAACHTLQRRRRTAGLRAVIPALQQASPPRGLGRQRRQPCPKTTPAATGLPVSSPCSAEARSYREERTWTSSRKRLACRVHTLPRTASRCPAGYAVRQRGSPALPAAVAALSWRDSKCTCKAAA